MESLQDFETGQVYEVMFKTNGEKFIAYRE